MPLRLTFRSSLTPGTGPGIVTLGSPSRFVADAQGQATDLPWTLTAPAPLRVTAARFACAAPFAPATADDAWVAVLQVRPAGSAGPWPDAARLDFHLADPPTTGRPLSLPPGGLVLATGDVLDAGVTPGSGPVLALDSPWFTLALESA